MKKRIIGIILLGCILFGACAEQSEVYESTPEHDAENKTGEVQAPPSHKIIHFQSYEELTELAGQNNLGAESSQEINNDKMVTFQTATRGLESQSLPIPCFNNQAITLCSTEGVPVITMFSSELYLKPWIWYRTCIDDEDITVRIMLDQEVINTLEEGTSCSDVVKTIAPDAPNVDNYQKYAGYSYIYEQKITTADGEKTGLVQRTTDGDEYISFIQNSFLVTLSGPQGVITSEWLEMFGITQNTLHENEYLAE